MTQRLTPEQHVAFSRRLGPLSRSPYIKHMATHPDIIAVLKEADERNISTFRQCRHSDFSFLEEPPLGSVLHAREVPDHGGDAVRQHVQPVGGRALEIKHGCRRECIIKMT
jgi:taurine dioxygenase